MIFPHVMDEFPALDSEVPPEWYATYRDTRFLSEWGVMAWSPSGVLGAGMILRWLETVEPRIGKFNRFIDFSTLSGVNLTFCDVVEISRRRCEKYGGEPVKTAILADSPLAYGIARMYEQLVSSAPIRVRVVADLAAAAEFLGVPAEDLRETTDQ